MHRTAQDADRIASHYTEAATKIAQEFRGRVTEYLAEIDRQTAEIAALPVSDKTKIALAEQNALIHRQVLNLI